MGSLGKEGGSSSQLELEIIHVPPELGAGGRSTNTPVKLMQLVQYASSAHGHLRRNIKASVSLTLELFSRENKCMRMARAWWLREKYGSPQDPECEAFNHCRARGTVCGVS